MKILKPGVTFYSRDEDYAALAYIVAGVKAMGLSTGRPVNVPQKPLELGRDWDMGSGDYTTFRFTSSSVSSAYEILTAMFGRRR